VTADADFILGLDLGKSQDFTALAAAQRTFQPDPERSDATLTHYAVRYLRRWHLGTPYTAIVRDLAALVEKDPLHGSLLAADQTGVGAVVMDLLREADLPVQLRPILITAGHATTYTDGAWHVPKKELVSTLQVLFQGRRLKVAKVPDREALVKELLAFKVKVNAATGHESFEAWRERDRDDQVLAIALACWLGERDAGQDDDDFVPISGGEKCSLNAPSPMHLANRFMKGMMS
jgi:hypothetical protein